MSILTNQRGVTLVFIAMGLLFFLLVMGAATDAGFLVYVRSQSQARVDAAALAASAALIQPTAKRQATATTLANTFSDQNSVVTASLDPANVLEPMKYNATTGALAVAPDWSPGPTGLNCNAVRVSTTVPTPVFFSGLRGVFGSSSATENIQVSATGFLPCPGTLLTSTGAGIFPLALRGCSWTFPQDCDTNQRLYEQSQQADNAMWITYNLGANNPNCSDIADGTVPSNLVTAVNVGDTVNVNNGQVTPCLRTLRDTYKNCTPASCSQEPADPACTALVPVVDCGGSASSAKVTGFASICLTGFDLDKNSPKWVDGSLECGEAAPGSAGTGGVCLGTFASNPVLVK